MDHGGHSGHSGHGGMDMPEDGNMCSMNMLFTWSTENLCIIFPSWRVTSTLTLILSLALVAILTAGYEAVRDAARRYDARSTPAVASHTLSGKAAPDRDARAWLTREGELGDDGSLGRTGRQSQGRRTTRAAFYAVQVFYSFFIMLLFMTYNGWVMLAVAVGAFVGHLAFAPADEGAAKTVACH